jgi:hypothetical protein
MAALVLSIAGAAAGSSVLGPVGAIIGRLVGAVAGNVIDQALFNARRDIALEGPRLSDLTVMASTEGAAIPRVYGRARLCGQVIWVTNLKAANTYICGRRCPLRIKGAYGDKSGTCPLYPR